MDKVKIKSEAKAILYIILTVLLIKVTVVEAYIVPTGSMENTIMTGDFLVGSRFVYGMRTPDWLGIPYTDIGFFIPYFKFPAFKIPKVGDVLIFKLELISPIRRGISHMMARAYVNGELTTEAEMKAAIIKKN